MAIPSIPCRICGDGPSLHTVATDHDYEPRHRMTLTTADGRPCIGYNGKWRFYQNKDVLWFPSGRHLGINEILGAINDPDLIVLDT